MGPQAVAPGVGAWWRTVVSHSPAVLWTRRRAAEYVTSSEARLLCLTSPSVPFSGCNAAAFPNGAGEAYTKPSEARSAQVQRKGGRRVASIVAHPSPR